MKEILEALNPSGDDVVFDGTLGGGGHSRALLEKLGPDGKLIAFDQDLEAVERNQKEIEDDRVTFLHENFANATEAWLANQLPLANKVLLDLGWSSDQFANPERGFSFQENGPLDMRLDTSNDKRLTAHDLVNTLNEEQLTGIIRNYGEERYAKRIAREIVYHRMEFGEIEDTAGLVAVIKEAVPMSYQKTRIHPATRTFQALRIAVNDELGVLERGLQGLLATTQDTATIAVISFHSLEDRIVKHTFKQWKAEGIGTIVTKKPITASERETKDNPRARSAKLRVFTKQ